jgi:hypothetical protein
MDGKMTESPVPDAQAASASGDAIPDSAHLIEVRVAELRQLFNAIDPSPFHERDLDPGAEEFIVEWGKDSARGQPLALLVHLDRGPGQPDEARILGDAVHEFFRRRAASTRRRLRELFRRGRISLAIAVLFLAGAIAVGDALAGYFAQGRVAGFVREGFLIGGWVAMWRPLEVFLYDWWPIRAEARLLDRLSVMPVRIKYKGNLATSAWRSDWPAAPAAPLAPGNIPDPPLRP